MRWDAVYTTSRAAPDPMNNRNLLKGLFLIGIALFFGVGALRYPLGHVERPGPGFFPLMVSSFLCVLGIAMVVRSRFMERVPMVFNFRNILIILASLVGFALLSHYVNMITGIVFMGYVAVHMIGNLKVYLGATAMDDASILSNS